MFALRGALRRAGFFVAAAALAAGAAVALTPKQSAESATSSGWVESWAAAPQKPTRVAVNKAYTGFDDETVRNIMFTSVGGSEIRIRLSNLFGTKPLDIGRASVGEVASQGNLTGPAYPVKFNGSSSVMVAPGQEVVSDPVPMPVAPLEDIAVSVYVPGRTGPVMYHTFGQQDNYIAPGNRVMDSTDSGYPTRTTSWYFLDGVDVLGADKRAGVVVALGDSITDGVGSTGGLNDRWPNFLARRLDAAYGDQAPAVID
jgi:hypothetical protein